MRKIKKCDMELLQNLMESTLASLQELQEKLQEFADTAQEYYDDRSEIWQGQEVGENYSAWIEALEYTTSDVENIIDELENVDLNELESPNS